ncbi:hypothetical protein LCGC14_1198470 [marine sediment metagenome]|uniref:Uncharacterized protein n=1 Tax=marine sediment metagenome TaxID=412755 RepID=A0A0F9M4Z6_9ZZZZ
MIVDLIVCENCLTVHLSKSDGCACVSCNRILVDLAVQKVDIDIRKLYGGSFVAEGTTEITVLECEKCKDYEEMIDVILDNPIMIKFLNLVRRKNE